MTENQDDMALIPYQTRQVTIREEDNAIDAQVTLLSSKPETVLKQYLNKLAPETKRRHIHDLKVFCRFLETEQQIQTNAEDLATNLEAWRVLPIAPSLIDDYCLWLQEDGYSVGSVNVRMSTIKAYCKHLTRAGLLHENVYAAIRLVENIKKKDARTVDTNRQQAGKETRKPDARKQEWVQLSSQQVSDLLAAIGVASPISRRDSLLIRLSWLHALRVGEIVQLKVSDLNQETGILTFDRPKTDLYNQKIRLSDGTLKVAKEYIKDRLDETTFGENAPLFASHKPRHKGEPEEERAILPIIASRRIAYLVKLHLGIEHASMHDGRHYWATDALSNKRNSLKDVMEAGGWKTPYIPLEYAAKLKIANENVETTELDIDKEKREE